LHSALCHFQCSTWQSLQQYLQDGSRSSSSMRRAHTPENKLITQLRRTTTCHVAALVQSLRQCLLVCTANNP
jgi:hypothetical protein